MRVRACVPAWLGYNWLSDCLYCSEVRLLVIKRVRTLQALSDVAGTHAAMAGYRVRVFSF